tara:strand:+ start:1191 stop:2285 length:1095 start_codon:yes stop_codon:yes gene_type:complete
VVEGTDEHGFYNKAPSPPLEVKGGVDTSALSSMEQQMLADLNKENAVAQDGDVFPPSLVESAASPQVGATALPGQIAAIPVSIASFNAADPVVLVADPEDGSSPGVHRRVTVDTTPLVPEPLVPEPSVPEPSVPEPLIPELKTAEASGPPAPPPLIDTEEEAPIDVPLAAGGELELQTCPHCSWDMNMPAIAEPSYDEKMGFLHSVLGQRNFTHQYEIFGGKVVIRFRTLTTKEMDIIYQQVFAERESGEITTIQDYWEKVNRYKLYLQLTYLAAVDGSFTHVLPEGYSPEANPHADECYKFKAAHPDHSYLPEIEKHVLEGVLRTETIQRSVNTICVRFNRLVAKLEAMIDNSDFWNATEEQS